MTIEKIPVGPYKQHQGEGDQLGYKGQGLDPPTQAAIEKINEIVDHLNRD